MSTADESERIMYVLYLTTSTKQIPQEYSTVYVYKNKKTTVYAVVFCFFDLTLTLLRFLFAF